MFFDFEDIIQGTEAVGVRFVCRLFGSIRGRVFVLLVVAKRGLCCCSLFLFSLLALV